MSLVRSLVLTILLCLSAASFALTPTITSIRPNVLPTSGGRISILTAGWSPLDCATICNFDIIIGGQAVPRANMYGWGPEISVTVPPHPASYADLELRHPYGEPAFQKNAILFVDEADQETVLLPAGGTSEQATPGAFGSQWRTSTLVVNDSDRTLRIDVPRFNPFGQPPFVAQFVDLEPHATYDLPLFASYPLVVRIPRAFAEQIAFQTRVYDESRATLNFGTHVPSVREQEFHRSRIVIAGVPTADPFRATLRIYSPDRNPRTFHVTLLTQPEQGALPAGGAPVQRGTVITELQASTQFTDANWASLPYSVPYSQLQLPPLGRAHVQVVIEPVDDGAAPFWAFVSITNNETQHVTVLTPR